MSTSDDVAFITGGAQGFGRAFAEALAGQGATVVLADIDVDAAEKAADELRDAGYRALALHCDVADRNSVDHAVAQAVEAVGGIDILINNAGLHLTKYNQPFSMLTHNEIRELFEVNVMGVLNCSLACADTIGARGRGRIVNISSMASYGAASPYGVTKLTVRGLTIALATEFAPAGIRCNAIAPGLTATQNALRDLPADLVHRVIHQSQLIPRLGQVDDIVKMLVFLCSDDASFITGETYKVSGGTPLFI
jgi:NAD(P)-dependent dehydrogenase (short-subunit alcohol dehydrogenase family)